MKAPKPDGPPGDCRQCGKRTVEGFWKTGFWVHMCFACQKAPTEPGSRRLAVHGDRYGRTERRPIDGIITINADGELVYDDD